MEEETKLVINKDVIKYLISSLNLKEERINSVLEMLSEGATIPFIARYRKDKTGNLNEDEIRAIAEQYKYQENLLNRKEDVIRLIDEKGLLTDEIKAAILACQKLAEVEDIYRPFKEKKKTKATDAINNGLEPLAKMIMSFPIKGSLEELASRFVNEKVESTDKALEGAGYIIAEWISDNAAYRKWIRFNVYREGRIVSKIKKGAEDPLEIITRREYFDAIEKNMNNNLSNFEKDVLKLYKNGYSYVTIANKLKTKVKSVDTAIQRIKKKATKIKERLEAN